MGDWFTATGYDTKYIGKWHLSFEDLLDEHGDTLHPMPRSPETGGIQQEIKDAYLNADRLAKFGFRDGWVGPEPHGPKIINSGWQRDATYVNELIEWLGARNRSLNQEEEKPFLLTLNLVNPHDIVFANSLWWYFSTMYDVAWPGHDKDVPSTPPSPTQFEDLHSKPSAQRQFQEQYWKVLATPADPMFVNEDMYRRFYLFLQKLVDAQVQRALFFLESTRFGDETIILYTSDHGEQLGSHGLRQKWHQYYEETARVPWTMSNKHLFPAGGPSREVHQLSSSLDILPTLLGLAGADQAELLTQLRATHTEAHLLPGKDWSQTLLALSSEGEKKTNVHKPPHLDTGPDAVYFETCDVVTQGAAQMRSMAKGVPFLKNLPINFEYDAVRGARCIEAVVVESNPPVGACKHWKYVRYFDDPLQWSVPGVRDVYTFREGVNRGQTVVKITPDREEYELYCLNTDPFEKINLANNVSRQSCHAKEAHIKEALSFVRDVLEQQRLRKALPRSTPFGPHRKFPEGLLLANEWPLPTKTVAVIMAYQLGVPLLALTVLVHVVRYLVRRCGALQGLVSVFSGGSGASALRLFLRVNVFGNGVLDVLIFVVSKNSPTALGVVFSSLSNPTAVTEERLFSTMALGMALPRLLWATQPRGRAAYVATLGTYLSEMIMFLVEARFFGEQNTPQWHIFATMTIFFIALVVFYGPVQFGGDGNGEEDDERYRGQGTVAVLGSFSAVSTSVTIAMIYFENTQVALVASCLAATSAFVVTFLSSSSPSPSSAVVAQPLPQTPPETEPKPTSPSPASAALRNVVRLIVFAHGILDLVLISVFRTGPLIPLVSELVLGSGMESQVATAVFKYRLLLYLCGSLAASRVMFVCCPFSRSAVLLVLWGYALQVYFFLSELRLREPGAIVEARVFPTSLAIGTCGFLCVMLALLFCGPDRRGGGSEEGSGFGGLSVFSHGLPGVAVLLWIRAPRPIPGVFLALSIAAILLQLSYKRVCAIHPCSGYCLVTGASKGIGRDIAMELGRKGFSLVLVARSLSELEQLKQDILTLATKTGTQTIECVALDLAQANAARTLKAHLMTKNIHVAALINNAGASVHGDFSVMDEDKVEFLLQLNVAVLTQLTRLLLPPMLARGRGRVMNIASVNGMIPGPGMAVYGATKAYVRVFSEALSVELESSGVSVTCVIPGAVDTSFAAAANVQNSVGYALSKVVPPFLAGYVGSPMASLDVAQAAVEGMMQGHTVVLPGLANRFIGYIVGGLFPSRISMLILQRFLS